MKAIDLKKLIDDISACSGCGFIGFGVEIAVGVLRGCQVLKLKLELMRVVGFSFEL